MLIPTAEESLLLQCLSTTALLGELSNNNFFNSEYFKQLPFSNEDFKKILVDSGLGNPATMLMMLYALLIVPKERLSGPDYDMFEDYVKSKIYPTIIDLAEKETYSTYAGEESLSKINYFRHLRNAVAHAKCYYFSENQKRYVIFSDSNNNTKECSIKLECCNVGLILMELQKCIMEYYNTKHNC
ncbi:MAG: hypothetical protein Q4C56_05020 [Peptococcaceae bacterium]|nr:hypothetical protein [Peptococcaceae bacterium]